MTDFNVGDRVSVLVLETCGRPGDPPILLWNSPSRGEPVGPFTYVRDSGCNQCYVIQDSRGGQFFVDKQYVRPESRGVLSGALDPVAQRMVEVYRSIVGQVIAQGFDTPWNAVVRPLGLPAASETNATSDRALASTMGVLGATPGDAAQVYRDFTRTVQNAGYATQWDRLVRWLGLPTSYMTLNVWTRASIAEELGLPATATPEPEPDTRPMAAMVAVTEEPPVGSVVARAWPDGSGAFFKRESDGRWRDMDNNYYVVSWERLTRIEYMETSDKPTVVLLSRGDPGESGRLFDIVNAAEL